MPYDQNIPQATDQIRLSQADLLANFQALNTSLSINHVALNAADEGKHKWVTFPEQVAGPATLLNEMAVYSKTSALSGVAELFIRNENSGTEVEFTSSLNAIHGWTRLSSGILLKWGQNVATGLTTINYPVLATIPVFANVYNVIVASYYAGGADNNSLVTIAGVGLVASFDVYAAQRTAIAAAVNAPFFWLAIGD